MNRSLYLFAPLRLTVWLLLACLIFIFFATLDQVEIGVRGAQIKYFESLVATWGYPATWPLGAWLHVIYLPIPGAYLLGPLLLLNLFCAHFSHFRPGWRTVGIVMIHFGVWMLICSQLFTQLFQQEYYIWFDEGQTVRHLTSFDQDELVIIDTSAAKVDTVYAIPAEHLKHRGTQSISGLPFTIETLAFYDNARIHQDSHLRSQQPNADRGLAVTQMLRAQPMPPTYKADQGNAASAYVRLQSGAETLGTWLVSTRFEESMPPQTFRYNDRQYTIALRFSRQPLDATFTLLDFAHDRYPGTHIPNNFSSHIRIEEPSTGASREALIRMNHPLRYAGYTFYQSAFRSDAMGREDRSSRLQVVRNPGWLGPYIACTLISLGLVWQFGQRLLQFNHRRSNKACATTPKLPTANHVADPKHQRMVTCLLLSLLVISTILILTKPFQSNANRSTLSTPFELSGFAQLPVLDGGRLKPLDTLARNFLILARGKQSALNPAGQPVPAVELLAQLLFDAETAAQYPIFRLDNPDVLDLVGQANGGTRHLTYAALRPHLRTIDTQAQLIPEDAAKRSPYHTALVKLHRSIQRYQTLEYGFLPPLADDQSDQLRALVSTNAGIIIDSPAIAALLRQQMGSTGLLLIPLDNDRSIDAQAPEWLSPIAALLDARIKGRADPMLQAFLELASAWRANDALQFDQSIELLQNLYNRRITHSQPRTQLEYHFNQIQPFYLSLQLYLIAFIGTALFWLLGQPSLARIGVIISIIALFIHSLGLSARIYLSGYAPVTNLYSSSVFVGWIAVLLSLPFERLCRNGLATAAAALIGFTTLIIAHNIAIAGGSDTMEMMRAVLDSNFWLATHVTTITIGYATSFLAGVLGILYLLLHFSRTGPDAATIRSLKQMVYGLICFALLFSFVGTILGGIWADQSWGRFWGWDPKENGALMVVLWNALILHGLRSSMFSTHGLMFLAIIGNIITSWSWFGTNMLGVGLHSYGFMNKAFAWLAAFWISQLILITAGWIHCRRTTSHSIFIGTSNK